MTALRGNHEEDFAWYVSILHQIDETYQLATDPRSNADSGALYDTAKYVLRAGGIGAQFFDMYGTVGRLLNDEAATLADLDAWAERLRALPLYRELEIGGRKCVIVHAGWPGSADSPEAEDFCLNAREEAYRSDALPQGLIVAGHTPTVLPGEFCFTGGRVFRYADPETLCGFYDIDCGCALGKRYPGARLACIRLEDERVYYVSSADAPLP